MEARLARETKKAELLAGPRRESGRNAAREEKEREKAELAEQAAAGVVVYPWCAAESLAETATETRRATASATKSRAATIARSTTRAGEGGEGKARADARAIGDAEKRRTQMCLDLGQSSMRHATCARCGLVYAKGDPSDEKTHAQYHAKFLANANGGGAGAMTLKPGEGQSAVWESEDGEARCVALDGGKATKSAIERVARGIERELNMPEDWILQQAKGAVKAYVLSLIHI